MELVPIKVVIGLRANGEADHPDFSPLPAVVNSGLHWDYYLMRNGGGWMYDNACGNAEQDDDSPLGEWHAMLLIPSDFADQAVAAFDNITYQTEAEATAFYENRHKAKTPRLNRDPAVLQGLLAEIQLQEVLQDNASGTDQQIYKRRLDAAIEDAKAAPDADNPTRGIAQTPGRTLAERLAEGSHSLREVGV